MALKSSSISRSRSRSRSRNSSRDNHRKTSKFEENNYNNYQTKSKVKNFQFVRNYPNEEMNYRKYSPFIQNDFFQLPVFTESNYIENSNCFNTNISQKEIASFNQTNTNEYYDKNCSKKNQHIEDIDNSCNQNRNSDYNNFKHFNSTQSETLTNIVNDPENSLSKNVVTEKHNNITSNVMEGMIISIKILNSEIKENQHNVEILNEQKSQVTDAIEKIYPTDSQKNECKKFIKPIVDNTDLKAETSNQINNLNYSENNNTEKNLNSYDNEFKYEDKFKLEINQLIGYFALKNSENFKIISKLSNLSNNELEENLKKCYKNFCDEILIENDQNLNDEFKFMEPNCIPVTTAEVENQLTSSNLSMYSQNLKYKPIRNEIHMLKKKIAKDNRDIVDIISNIEKSYVKDQMLSKQQNVIQSRINDIFSNY